MLHRRLLPGQTLQWFLGDVLRPLLAAGACVALARALYPAAPPRLVGLVWLGGTVGVAMAAAVLVSPGVLRYLRAGPLVVEES